MAKREYNELAIQADTNQSCFKFSTVLASAHISTGSINALNNGVHLIKASILHCMYIPYTSA